jgi:hypothetical protein
MLSAGCFPGVCSLNADVSEQWRKQEYFFGGGGSQPIQLRKEGRENGNLRAIAPNSGGSTQLANE